MVELKALNHQLSHIFGFKVELNARYPTELILAVINKQNRQYITDNYCLNEVLEEEERI